jgi:hypothetical protein
MAPPNKQSNGGTSFLRWAGFILTIGILLSTSVYNVAISHAAIDSNKVSIKENKTEVKHVHSEQDNVKLKLAEISGDIKLIRQILEAQVKKTP